MQFPGNKEIMVQRQTFRERLVTKLFSRFPVISEIWARQFKTYGVAGIPWTPFEKELPSCTVAIITTAGVHLKAQQPFDMKDCDGDPTFREILRDTPRSELTITHKYYDHTDADKDINIVFPIDRLNEMKQRGEIGGVSGTHYGLMGHIMRKHLKTLVEVSAPEIAMRLRNANIDIALLTPG